MNAEQTLYVLKNMPKDKAIMLTAKHGVGKSSIVKQAAKDLNVPCIDIRLSQCADIGDLKGLPRLNEEFKRTEFFKPKWWPKENEPEGFIFLDEINRASKDILQGVFELSLDRSLDGDKLPDGWRVIGAINGSDEYDVIDMDPALADRWFYIKFNPSVDEWLNWGRKVGIHASVLDFISVNKELLDPPVGSMEPGKIYPSRRSWKSFDDTMKALNLYNSKNEGLITSICEGWVGENISIMFPKFLLNDASRIDPSDVLFKFEQFESKIGNICSDIELVSSLSLNVFKTMEDMSPENFSANLPKISSSLKRFIAIIPKDVAALLWTNLLKGNNTRAMARSWNTDPAVTKVLSAIFTS